MIYLSFFLENYLFNKKINEKKFSKGARARQNFSRSALLFHVNIYFALRAPRSFQYTFPLRAPRSMLIFGSFCARARAPQICLALQERGARSAKWSACAQLCIYIYIYLYLYINTQAIFFLGGNSWAKTVRPILMKFCTVI